jgi:Family of unknown function (DUF6580)
MLPALVLIFAAILYRIGYVLAGSPADWGNFAPVAAIVLCSSAYFSRRLALLIPVAAILVSDLVLNALYRVPLFDTAILSRYFCFALIFWLGDWIGRQQHRRRLLLLGGSVVSSILFYFFTNAFAWLVPVSQPFPLPPYPRTLDGLYQALFVGQPGFPSPLLFFRNTFLSDLFFTVLFVVAVFGRTEEPAPTTAARQARP